MSPEEAADELPRLLVLGDRFTDPGRSRTIERLASGTAIRWIQLRDHRARRALFRGRGSCLVDRLREHRSELVISVNSDVGFARNLDIGVHLGFRGPSVAGARNRLGADALIGFSAHDIEEAVEASAEGASYVTCSPVFPTDSKPDHPGVGLSCLAEVCKAVDEMPVIALGGITPDRVEDCLAAGAHGVAVLSGILYADDPVQAAAAYLANL